MAQVSHDAQAGNTAANGGSQVPALADGERALHNGATLLMCGAAAHAVYLGAAPESLRLPIALRNARLWKRLSLGALLVVAAYDGWQARRLTTASAALSAQIKALNNQLLQPDEEP